MPSVEDILGPAPAARPAPVAKPSVTDLLGPPPVDSILGAAPTAAAAPKQPPATAPQGPAPATPGAPLNGKHGLVAELGGDAVAQAGKTTKGYYDALKGDFTRPLNPKKGLAALPLRALKTGADALGNAFGPEEGAIASIAGRPVEKATGGKVSRDTVGAVGQMATPFAAEAKLPGTAMKVGEAVEKALPKFMQTGIGRELHAVASPATVDDDARAAHALHRSVLGQRVLEADKALHGLQKHARVVARLKPEEQAGFLDYVENRSKGAKLANPKLQKAADAIRAVSEHYRGQIESVLGRDGPTFIKDYFAHLWKQNPDEVEKAMGGESKPRAPRQGSAENTRARSIPTYSEGLKAGLTPRFDNPMDAMSAYAENMARFLATHQIRRGMIDGVTFASEGGESRTVKLAQWARPGEQPAGWVPLKGAGVERPARGRARLGKGGKPKIADILGDKPPKADPMAGRRTDKVVLPKSKATPRDRPVDKQVLYAPEGAARIYNNHIDQGAARSAVYRGARSAANAVVQLNLGLSAFHGAVMGEESAVSAGARAINQLAKGRPLTALKTAVTAPVAPLVSFLRGQKMGAQLLGEAPPSALDGKLNDIWANAGGRLKMDRIYSTRGAGSFFGAMKRGTLVPELKAATRKLYTGSMLSRAQGAVDIVGNVIQSAAAPLFEHYIPAVKRGAWAQRMSDYLRDNPNASQADLERMGRNFLDNVDNRFGEVINDNNFWNKTMFQIGQLALLSPSWNIGTVREIGGGVLNVPKSMKSLVKGKGIDDKTAYVVSLVGMTMMQNAIATKLRTGVNPEGEDFFAYRTGGRNPDGSPERAMIPGYMKDVYALTMGDPLQEAVNKLNPALKIMAYELANKDYRSQPIRDPYGSPKDQLGQGFKYAADQAAPISFKNTSQGNGPASKMTPWESLAGIRPTPAYMHEGYAAREKGYAMKAKKRKLHSDAVYAAKHAKPKRVDQ